MKIASVLFFELAAGTLAIAGYLYSLPELAIASILLGGLTALGLLFLRPAFGHAVFILYGALTAVFGLFRMPPILCAGALAAALIGWDARRIAPQVSAASLGDRRRFAIVYSLRAVALAGIGVLLVAAAGTIRISLTFGSGLGFSFAVLVLAALFLRVLRRDRNSGEAKHGEDR